ncbi:TetR family transcriptional regulator [Leucobacter sp. CSA2]|uniref:TetR family transcriptional regulator n=1 Tax=Leucobacter edaphi TaxID=2796472 RepID=A0A934QE00_9MICO|nr:TetR family transcriptional regulator [Leucobacter edaphi]MBK0422783.1 TetR family transcriptional regulator [Leucobacter edaphi]
MLAEPAAPRKRDPEGRRRAILEAATELIVESGAAALTHRAVAARAGVPLGSTTQYFASIDELRDSALQVLADEIELSLARMEPAIALIHERPEVALAEAIDFLSDRRAVLSDIALLTTAVTDPRLNELALRWTNRLIEMLAAHIGRARATAIALYLDGAAINAGLSGGPIPVADITRTLRALVEMPIPLEDPGARSGS